MKDMRILLGKIFGRSLTLNLKANLVFLRKKGRTMFLVLGVASLFFVSVAEATKPTPTAPLAQTPPLVNFPVEKEVLTNGLTVLYDVNRTIPLVSYHT